MSDQQPNDQLTSKREVVTQVEENNLPGETVKEGTIDVEGSSMNQDSEITIVKSMSENEGGGEPNPIPVSVSNEISQDSKNVNRELEEDITDKDLLLSFPVPDLTRLDEMISNPRWVVPVLPGGQLEILLETAISLCKKGLDVQSEHCQRFFREGLTVSFTKILTDDAVSSWKSEIHTCILRNSEKLLELIVTKLSQDWFPLLDLLGILFNPTNKFHTFNACRPPESYALDAQLADDELYARHRHIETRLGKGWLVDLINLFGSLGGFQILLERFSNGPPLSVGLAYALLKPFGLCADFLTKHTIEKYFTVVFKIVPQFLENLSDDELKKETAKSDIISSIIKCLKCLEARIAESDEHMRTLELFRLRMILRMLQVSSFKGKMNALNEINQVIQNVQSYYPHHHRLDEVEYLTGKRIAEWISENQVLQITLRDSLHQPQYVEKIEKILRFIIKERTLTLSDLDHIWAAQVGKHDAIVKNVHDLLAKLAWDFSPEQLDHLFECFQASWTTANKRQREKLLELIRRLAEDDKDGLMAFKVLTLFWNLARSSDVPTEIMDQALTAHVKVLDYSCSQRENQKYQWLNTSMSQLLEDDVEWVIPAMKHMREIFSLYPEGQGGHNKNTSGVFRPNVISRLQTERQLIVSICNSLNTYEERARTYLKEKGNIDPHNLKLDGRYSHVDQIRERLNFLRFLLKEGRLWLCKDQANLVWECLAENPAFILDREMCFEWFSKLMDGEEPDLDPQFIGMFFESKILTLDPTLLTENGIECFEKFFRAVNLTKNKLVCKREEYYMDDLDMDGNDYLWKIILSGSEDMANRAIQLLRSICTALGPTLLPKQKEVHEDFLSHCADRLKSSYDTVLVLEKDKDSINRVRQEVTRICRVLRVLLEYVVECDGEYRDERAYLPLYRACRGRSFSIYIRLPSPVARTFEDIEIHTHYNETLAGLQRQIIRLLKEQNHINSNFKLDLYYNGEVINLTDDRQVLSAVGLRDKMMLQGKLVQANATNSPDSSEDSPDSPNHFQNGIDGPNIEAEECLPSVMLASDEKRMEFFCLLVGLASRLGDERLRDVARNMLTMLPICRATESALKSVLVNSTDKKAYNYLFNANHAIVLYRLEVLFVMLFPALGWDDNETLSLMKMFFVSGIAGGVVEMLTKNNFMPLADMATKRSAYLVVLKLTKAVLTVLGHLILRFAAEFRGNIDRVRAISDALQAIPNQNELAVRKVGSSISHVLYAHAKEDRSGQAEGFRQMLKAALVGEFPDLETIKLVIKLAGSTASGSLAYFSNDHHQANRNPSEDDIYVCEEALEVLTLSFVLNPQALEQIQNDQHWKGFICTVLFHTMSRHIRIHAVDQLYMLAVKCGGSCNMLQFFINFLFETIQTSVVDLPCHSNEVFRLLCHLLHHACSYKVVVPRHEQILLSQIEWLRNAKVLVKENAEGNFQEELLEGYICVARELIGFLSPEKKYQIGNNPENSLLREILEEFVFPWSKTHSVMKRSGEVNFESPVQICNSSMTQTSILDLVASLCTNCLPNLKYTVELLNDLFGYSNDGDGMLSEWEYVPGVGSRPLGGFVGLKNAGATCYMNSVLQQLFMVDSIKRGVLAANASNYCDEEADDANKPADAIISRCQSDSSILESNNSSSSDDRKSYNITILKQIQSIFGHLALSKLQYHVPNGLWKNFRLQGEAVNLREQQDAVEFFMSLIDSVDDGLKAIGEEQVMAKNLGGLFSDQKISKECLHRYSKEEPFSVISVDIRNHSNLLDSLEQYVKGDLLEGADAYHCERCNKKVVTVKRLCVKKLPPVLAIQLKRFEYDYERVCSVKFNDYFEFPRDLEMEPYTVSGLAKIEGEIIDDDADLLSKNVCTSYRLTGIVVHSGQASGGHYYSYISHKCPDGVNRWFKFDDGEVSECRMDDLEELKNQCFGGDYAGEVFDHMMKRMSFRRQKRWWNAYILFYTQTDILDGTSTLNGKMSTLSVSAEKRLVLPAAIEKNVLKQNVEFMHIRSHFSQEYFQFIKKLVAGNFSSIQIQLHHGIPFNEEMEELGILSVQLATKFLFSIGFRTKKVLRGAANEWFEILAFFLKLSKKIRFWFATHALFTSPCRICEYLLECPSTEIRAVFSKLLVVLASTSKDDGIYVPSIPMVTLTRSVDKNASLSEYILEGILNLLRRDVSEYGRHLVQYFTFFVNYANLGNEEKLHLINLDVPATFMLVALEDGPCPPIKYQCADLSKLYQVVSILIRSCDVSHKCKTLSPEIDMQPNPYIEPTISETLVLLPENVCDIVYGRGTYFCSHIKKVLDEAFASEDTMLLIQFLCWENSHFSQIALSEVLSHIGYSYSPELKTFLDILVNLLRIQDSWQLERIKYALKGIPDERDGLLDIIHRNKQSHPKRTYLFMKCITNLLEPNSLHHGVLTEDPDLSKKWNNAVDWLQYELERRAPTGGPVYGYATTGWSPPSNEGTNGSFFLERSLSAKTTLDKAVELRIDLEPGVEKEEEDQISSEGEGEDWENRVSSVKNLEETEKDRIEGWLEGKGKSFKMTREAERATEEVTEPADAFFKKYDVGEFYRVKVATRYGYGTQVPGINTVNPTPQETAEMDVVENKGEEFIPGNSEVNPESVNRLMD